MYYDKHRKHFIISFVVFCCLIIAVLSANYFDKGFRYSMKNFDIVRVGVLDGERLKEEALCFKTHDEIAKMVSNLLEKVRKDTNDTRSLYEKTKNNPKLPAKNRKTELSKIESKWSEASKKYNEEMQSIRNLDLKLSEFIQEKLDKAIKSLAKASKLDLIINKGNRNMINVFYNSQNIDITDMVIKKMDEILPSVNLKELQK